MTAAAPRTGTVPPDVAGRSLALAAEELLRASGDARLRWRGSTVATLFQPIYCVRRRFSLGFEACASVSGPCGEVIEADELFAATPESERALLDWSCRALHLRNYATVDPGDRTLFLNVHPEAALRDAPRAREFADLIRYYGLVPKRVCLEIADDARTDVQALAAAIAAYRDVGISVAVDGFHGDAADFSRLEILRPDVVKVEASRSLAAIVERVRRLRARVTVVNIEDAAQAMRALEAKADYLQGFHFAAPHDRLDRDVAGAAALDQLLHARR